jgi:hypothetical protein
MLRVLGPLDPQVDGIRAASLLHLIGFALPVVADDDRLA